MNAPATPPESVTSKRARFALMATITLCALVAAALFANIIGEKRSTRIDLTATREHTLAPRTQAILAQLDQPLELVVSADVRSIDARSMQRVRDVLDEFQRASGRLGVTIIDTGTTAAAADFARVIALLAERNAAEITTHRLVLTDAQQALGDLAEQLPALAQSLLSIATASKMADAENINTQALLIGEVATSCSRAAEGVRAALQNTVAGSVLPATDEAQSAANAPFQNAIATAGAVDQWASEVATRARASSNEATRAIAPLANDLAAQARTIADHAAIAFDALTRLGPLEPLQIARAIQVTPAVLIIAPNGTTAINLESLFPAFADPTDTAGRAQVRFVGEELIATAISTLLLEHPPILAIVHADREPLFDRAGRLANPNGAALASIIDRCRLRRIDVVEWPCAVDFARPMFTDINPDGRRPIVWFVPGAPSRLNLDRTTGMTERATRIGHLADAIRTLINAQQNILMAVEPSELPGAGQPDLLAEPLRSAFGLIIDTGHPLIERITMPNAIGYSTYQSPAVVGDSPLASALANLKVLLQWPMPMTTQPTDQVTVAPLLQAPADADIWGEAQWMPLRYANERRPFMSFSPRTAIDPDPERDNVTGPWVVAAAIEKRNATEQPPQRAVIVASPSWYEAIYDQQAELEGRNVALYPGNRELFDNAIWWLSGIDNLIGSAATATDVPRIAQLSAQSLALWRWTLIAGVPVLLLLVGIAFRFVKG
ncbi:MAG: Gldg family protein [Phycisphaerales bacterium]|nr:Gldg family protein [Phycisphaerales bacterium]